MFQSVSMGNNNMGYFIKTCLNIVKTYGIVFCNCLKVKTEIVIIY